MELEHVAATGHSLVQVKALWRANSATLGFFPEGAFAEYARRKGILAARDVTGDLAGYVLFRISRGNAIVVHLCVSQKQRGTGVAKFLFDNLKRAVADCAGIKLTCRSDFLANQMWPRLGFEPRAERSGREPGRTLKTWWYDNGHPDLFTVDEEIRSIAVLDANVFFDLQDPEFSKNEESKALMMPWIHDVLNLSVSSEIFVEIDRSNNSLERERRRSFVSGFSVARGKPETVNSVYESLGNIFTGTRSDQDNSDVRHLAHAVAIGADFFVTRDGAILRKADRILAGYGIQVLRPFALISLTDTELDSAKYQPSRLSGSELTIRRATPADVDALTATFLNHQSGEKKTAFLDSIRAGISQSGSQAVWIIGGGAGALHAVIRSVRRGEVLDVPLLRVTRDIIGATLARHLVWRTVIESVESRVLASRISDPHLQPLVLEALRANGYSAENTGWTRGVTTGLYRLGDLLARLPANDHDLANDRSRTISVDAPIEVKKRAQLAAEQRLWPARADDSALETFIVPIQPKWALHLFAERAAAENLFGAESRLMLNVENVYYRSSAPAYPDAPCRVLWYVSSAQGYSDSMHLVACSLVTSTIVGKPKDVFARFRRLGVFSWRDVVTVARGDITKDVLAFTFTHTELFANPVPWQILKSVLNEFVGTSAPIQSPRRVNNAIFRRLITLASDGTPR